MNKILGYKVGLEVNGEYLGIRTLPICYDKTAYNFDEIYQQKFEGINKIVSSLGIPVHDGYNIVKLYFGGEYNGQALPPVQLEIKNVNVDGDGYYRADLLFKQINFGSDEILSSQSVYLRNDSKFEYIYLTFGKYSIKDDTYSTMYAGLDYRTNYERHIYYQRSKANGFKMFLENVTDFAMGFPYGAGESEPKGGDGTMEDSSTPILVDSPRTMFVGNLFRVYNLSVVNLSELSSFLLDPSFTSSVSKLFNDPMDYLTSLVAIPFSGFTGSNETISIGSVESSITAQRLNNFIADLDCGEIEFEEYFGTFMDYSPYTRVTLYLPMIGYVDINVDAFQNDKLLLNYRIDVLTGQCVAFLSNSKGLVASYNGNCAYHIPLRSRDYSQMISGIANTAASTLIGGVSAPSFNGALNGALNFKPAGSVTTAGSFSGNCGVLTNRKPYIIIERPSISVPKSYGHNIGYKSEITEKLSNLHGFTTVKAIHLDNVIATAEEKDELESLLLSGVVLP